MIDIKRTGAHRAYFFAVICIKKNNKHVKNRGPRNNFNDRGYIHARKSNEMSQHIKRMTSLCVFRK